MFNRKSILFNGQLYVLKLKKIKENQLYNKLQDISEIKSELILDKSFLSIESLEIIDNNDKIKIEETSGINSFENRKEMLSDKNIKEIENDFINDLIESIEEENIMIQIEVYNFISPEIKISDKEFDISKMKINTNDLTTLTDFIVDEKVINSIIYDKKEIDIYKTGFIFKKYIKKDLISKKICTYVCEDIPNLENRIDVKL
tara:strand:- start:1840 stop:2445 length:606 start_codon:yes stop_codon:yes gene_type:complete